ncbi:SDR family NAD(P)-dependent oxidoreductase, partial [Dactylosporangium sp. NPDC005572]|uniref:SDR family NAD(P)-dependent oxidoreductase n=1 Tax=Dactylosporangium sp. NPDC005572 TaxID=3156889 RepID=UPI0033AD89A6
MDRNLPWPRPDDRPRRAGVSAFAISGTNAHLILEEAPVTAPAAAETGDPAVPWLLSARTPEALRDQASRLLRHLERHDEHDPAAIGHTLAAHRTHFAHRAALLTDTDEDRRHGLALLAGGRTGPGVVAGTADGDTPVVFVFPGQGAQWAGMARELLDTSDVFRTHIQRCADAFAPHVDWSLVDVLHGAEGAPGLDRVDVVQPALFAMMVSLAALWRAAGVEPAAVIGHSQGEIAAACVAGALSLDDAARVVTRRSQAIAAIAGRGGMASVALPVDEAARFVERWDGRLAVAVVNSPRSVVVAGDADALTELVAACQEAGIRARRVDVDYASHTTHVERVRADVTAALAGIRPAVAPVPVYSTLTGAPIPGDRLDAGYWYRNLREPVRFEAATRRLLETGHRLFVEVSPHPVLVAPITETAEDADTTGAVVVGTLRRGEGGHDRLRKSMAHAHVAGARVGWADLLGPRPDRLVSLPAYAFQHEHYWLHADAPRSGEGGGGRRYRIAWRPVPGPGSTVPAAGDWLVLVTPALAESPEAAAVAAALGGRARIQTDLAGPDPDLVLSLLALDPAHRPADTLRLIQAGPPAPLWCLTRGAVSTGPGDPLTDPDQAQVWGLGLAAGLEVPHRWGGLADLPARLDDAGAARLVAAIAAGGEDQLALRPGGVLVRRLVPAPTTSGAQDAGWPVAGAALVTGGTGGVGAHVARALAADGVTPIVLASRRGPEAPGADALEAELEALGADVTVAACDVTDPGAVRALAGELAERGTPIRSVFHAAGTAAALDLADTTPDDLAAARRAKVDGARTLAATLDGLDRLVLFTSGAGIWGGGGQGAYAAANACLDALAEQWRAAGIPAQAVAWGLWAGAGMGEGQDGDRLRRRGVVPMSAATALGELRAATRTGEHLVVADLDWPRFVTGFAAVRPVRLFDEIPAARAALDALRAPAPAG